MSILSQFYGGGSIPLAQGGGVITPNITIAEVLLVGGGGAGSPDAAGAQGGGSGGCSGAVILSSAFAFTQGTTYTITIGGSASDSSIIGGNIKLIAKAGSSAVVYDASPTASPVSGSGSQYNIDEYTTSYGFAGVENVGSGGGGAGGMGYEIQTLYTDPFSPALYVSGAGGGGINSNITGITTAYGGGGGGGAYSPASRSTLKGGKGGRGGGGAGGDSTGSPPSSSAGYAGAINTGGGGGGAGVNPTFPGFTSGGAGGSGICVIRYPTAYRAAPSVTSNAPTPAQPGYNVYRWNSGPATITF